MKTYSASNSKNLISYFLDKYDPTKFILNIITRVTIALCICLPLSLFINNKVALWNYLLISFSTNICIVGRPLYRNTLFFIFWMSSLSILLVSPFLYTHHIVAILFTVTIVYILALITHKTRFERLFPSIVGVLALSVFSTPIPVIYRHELILSFLFTGTVFFLVAIAPNINSNNVLFGLNKFFCVYLSDIYKDILVSAENDSEAIRLEKEEFLLIVNENIKKGRILLSSDELLKLWGIYALKFIFLTNNTYQILFQYKKLVQLNSKYIKVSDIKNAIEIIIYLISGLSSLNEEAFQLKIKELDSITSLCALAIGEIENIDTLRTYEILVLLGSTSHTLVQLRQIIGTLPK